MALLIVFRNYLAYIKILVISAERNLKRAGSCYLNSNMASEAWSNANFHRAIDSVCEVFRVSSLYPEQEECLKAILQGKDVYAGLLTGHGKSLIFYAVPIVSDQVFERPAPAICL